MAEKIQMVQMAVLWIALSLSVYTDISTRKIPNWLTVSLFIAGGIIQCLLGTPLVFLQGAALAAVIGIVGWMVHVIQAGDAKLFIALGALMGWNWLLWCGAYSLIWGAGIGVVILLAKGALISRMKQLAKYFQVILLSGSYQPYITEKETQNEFPFAVAIALGAGTVLLL